MPLPLSYAALAGFQVISGLHQSEMVKAQADIQKQIDEFNAQQAEYDAWKAEGYGQTQMAVYQTQVDKAMAAAKVGAAAEGVKIEGSLSEVVDENKSVALSNMLEIENQARERALGYTRQARSVRMGSQFSQAQATAQSQSVKTGALLSAGSTLVTGYGKK